LVISPIPVGDQQFEAVEQCFQGDLELLGGMVLRQFGFQALEPRVFGQVGLGCIVGLVLFDRAEIGPLGGDFEQ